MDERDAVRRMRAGDVGGLEPLVHAHQQRAVRAAYLVTRDRAQAEDIVQSAFIRAFERINQLRSADAFGPWFLRSVVNDATKAAARGRRQIALDFSNDASVTEPALVDPQLSAEELVAGIETRTELWRAMETLAPEQRAVIVLHYYLGLSGAEIAERVGIHPGTVRWRLHAARRRLRRILQADQRDERHELTEQSRQ